MEFLKTKVTLSLVLKLVAAVASIALGWGGTLALAKQHESNDAREFKEHAKRIGKLEGRADDEHDTLIELKTDTKWIREAVEKIERTHR